MINGKNYQHFKTIWVLFIDDDINTIKYQVNEE